MKNKTNFSNKRLLEVCIGRNHKEVHPAWKDDTNESFLICYDIDLIFDDYTTYSVQPCEVEIPDRYPALGLSVEEKKNEKQKNQFEAFDTPIQIDELVESDYLGEGTINQFSLVLGNGEKIIIRHVFPPMTLGIKVEGKNA